MTPSTLTAERMQAALTRLGALADEAGEKIELVAVGGAVMVLKHNHRESTKDVDAVFRRPVPTAPIRRWAATVAVELELPSDWLNDGHSPRHDLGQLLHTPEHSPRRDLGRAVRAFGRWSALTWCVCLSGCIELSATGKAPAASTTPPPVPVVAHGNAESVGEIQATGPTSAEPLGASGDDDGAWIPIAPPRVPSGAAPNDVFALALGENHTCSLTAAGRVRCWGYNTQGQLGVGNARNPGDGIVAGIGEPSDGSVRTIAAGGYQTCALTAAGHVWCWGSNHKGQVGTGEVTEAPIRTPTLVRGVEGVAALALGDATSCAITRDGALYCWGDNSQGQIDDSGQAQRPSPTRVAGIERAEAAAVGNYHLCVLRSGRVTCRGELARLARDVAALDDVHGISAGWGHSCALRRGVPHCWGKSYLGILGLGRNCPAGTSATCNADVLYPPRPIPGLSGAVQIEGHDYHTCVRLESGAVTCWGNNQGHAFARDLPAEPWQTAHAVDAFEHAVALFVGGSHVCVLRDGVPSCVGNDWAGAVRGAPAR